MGSFEIFMIAAAVTLLLGLLVWAARRGTPTAPGNKSSEMNEVLSIGELERRMRPGAFSGLGFLGPEESLEKVMAKDNQTLETLGVSHEQIADALEKILQSVLDQRSKLLKDHFSEYFKRESYRIPDLYDPKSIHHFSLRAPKITLPDGVL
jgi:hypothetical protein